jgi:hypothetical protein
LIVLVIAARRRLPIREAAAIAFVGATKETKSANLGLSQICKWKKWAKCEMEWKCVRNYRFTFLQKVFWGKEALKRIKVLGDLAVILLSVWVNINLE